jgi:hypothetical protein
MARFFATVVLFCFESSLYFCEVARVRVSVDVI